MRMAFNSLDLRTVRTPAPHDWEAVTERATLCPIWNLVTMTPGPSRAGEGRVFGAGISDWYQSRDNFQRRERSTSPFRLATRFQRAVLGRR
jgi:hypothetical protein